MDRWYDCHIAFSALSFAVRSEGVKHEVDEGRVGVPHLNFHFKFNVRHLSVAKGKLFNTTPPHPSQTGSAKRVFPNNDNKKSLFCCDAFKCSLSFALWRLLLSAFFMERVGRSGWVILITWAKDMALKTAKA